MMKQFRKRWFWIAFFSVLLLAGCSSQDGQQSRTALFKKVDPAPILISPKSSKDTGELNDIKKTVVTDDSTYDVAVARKDKEVLVSYKVKHSQRFQMKKIEKELTKKLEKNYPHYTFSVSSDYKIFLEIVRLGEKLESKKMDRKKAEKRFGEIKTLKDELT
ncbi:putative lipoprotein YmbA [Peribacillus deserti]|uniref:Lipoprotein YmbA n=1 Tax=Peribacillus deserti TaxID=673318 RepID=A0ABS2QIM1_9BACI|nr:sporulation protein [Peribacillus deserti]MBM7693018.1 putative lipoprotein YmbA [Peribacillus deserti]